MSALHTDCICKDRKKFLKLIRFFSFFFNFTIPRRRNTNFPLYNKEKNENNIDRTFFMLIFACKI